ncbi:alpha/beta-hydrolase [Schizopora paradoxa]|uniref:Carboxypeptidase n=1 Tax=Schizopora paradoxa TaxID=27342 RepID=A0A0H2R6N2_9AGAM|nr:alpha/beta-hydrolase [Schizopora paradoxa]
MGSLTKAISFVFSFLSFGTAALAQAINSFPKAYPGMPSGDFSTAWQTYYEVTDPLPNISFALSRNWAGTIPVNRANHTNDTLFFWAFEKENGSLTANAGERSDEPWAIWLSGGPGSSSMLGLMLENGPIQVLENGSMVQNDWSWDKLADYIWIDQPVGTGYSTADTTGYVVDEDQMGSDFLGFLSNLVKIFPSLATRPLYLTGESYAGFYIPYIAKALFSTPSPPVQLAKIVIGNAYMGNYGLVESPAMSIIETYPQLIGYDQDVYNYFKEQSHLCGYDLQLTYPQNGIIPTLNASQVGSATGTSLSSKTSSNRLQRVIRAISIDSNTAKTKKRDKEKHELEREEKRHQWKTQKRDLSGRPNGTIDPWYGCFLTDEVIDYALNFSMPWNLTPETIDASLHLYSPFNPYDIPDARSFPPILDPTTFLNDPKTRAALHAPTSINWTMQINYPFGSGIGLPPSSANFFTDPSLPPAAFFSELATNASDKGVGVVLYSGNDDSVVAHFSTEVVIQNTTFGGIQGFTRQPSTPFTDDKGNFAGIVHQERNWTYALFNHAGHAVPEFVPQAAFVFFREFILGTNQTGLVVDGSKGSTSVVGGEDKTLLIGDVLPGQTEILYNSGTVQTTQVYPSATIAAWDTFIAKQHPSNSGASFALVFPNGFLFGIALVLGSIFVGGLHIV